MRPLAALLLAMAFGFTGCAGGDGASQLAPIGNSPEAAGLGTERTMPVVPGRPARVFILAAVGKSCEAIPVPGIEIEEPPRLGEVSFRPGQETSIATATSAACLGKTALGTGIYYTARAGASGRDQFTISARPESGEQFRRTFSVTIAE